MAMVDVDYFRQTSGPSQLAWSKGLWPLGTILHSSDEVGELPQWLCHDNSTATPETLA